MARKVLVADDSPTVQKKASGILVGEGMEVVTVSNGVAAIKKLPTVNPMVILADVAMPGKDGYEVCEFVKASKEYANVPVLLVFSDGDLYDEAKGARARADGRIKKPFDREELISLVSRHLAAAEAAAAKPVAPPPVVKAPPPSFVSEPVDEEPIMEEKEAVPDFSQFGGGVAFAEALEEIAATPAEPAAAPPPAVETAPSMMDTEPPIVEPPVIEPEIAAAIGPPTESAAPEVELPPPAEPVLIEEQAVSEPAHDHPHEHPHESPSPVERTVIFRAPAEIAEPILSDDLSSAPPVVEAPPVEPALAPEPALEAAAPQPAFTEAPAAAAIEAPAIEEPPVAATTLDSYSLSEAAEGNVHLAHAEPMPEPVPPAAVEAPAAEAAPAAVEAPRALDADQVYSIVHMVVAKMSPRLPADAIEDIAKPIADEIAAELKVRPQ